MQGSSNFVQSPNGPNGQNRHGSLDNRNHIGSRNSKNRQNAVLGLSGYPAHMNNTSQDVSINAGLIPGQNLTQNGAQDANQKQNRTEHSPQMGPGGSSQKAMNRKQISSISENRGTTGNGIQHQKHVTATFNKDFMEKINKDQNGQPSKQGQGFNPAMVSRNQRQSNQNAKKLVGHALTSGEAQKQSMAIHGGQYAQHNYNMKGVGMNGNNFPAIRTSQNNGFHNLSQGNVEVINKDNIMAEGMKQGYGPAQGQPSNAQTSAQGILSRQQRGQNQIQNQFQNQNARNLSTNSQNTNQNNYNGRVFSGSGLQQRMAQNPQTQSYQPGSISGKIGMHQQQLSSSSQAAGSNIVGAPSGNKVSMKQNQRINSHQNRNLNQMGRVGAVIGAQGSNQQNHHQANSQNRDQLFNDQNNDQIGKGYRQQLHQQNNPNHKGENKLTLTMNRQSIQSRGNMSGTGVSIKSTKSGGNPQSGIGQMNVGLGTTAANGVIANRIPSSSNAIADRGSPERDYTTNSSKQAKIKEKIQNQIKNNPIIPVRSGNKRNNADVLDNKYFSERQGARPSSSRMGPIPQDQQDLSKTNWNNRSSINTGTTNGQYATSGKTGNQNMYPLQNNGQNMILNKYLQQSNHQIDGRRPSSQKSYKNNTNSERDAQQQSRRHENLQSNRQNASAEGGLNMSPNKARSFKQDGKSVQQFNQGSNLNTASPLYKGANQMIQGSMNQDYNSKTDPRSQSSKFKGNQFQNNQGQNNQNKPHKSRNETNPQNRLVGMTPSEQALFSSNREKSPIPLGVEGTSSDNSIARSQEQPQSEQNIISASVRNDTANRKLVGNNYQPQEQAGSPILEGETGNTNNQSSTNKQKEDKTAEDKLQDKEDKESSQTPQKSLPNKFGQFDPVIQEVEREVLQKQMRKESSTQNIIDAQFKGQFQSNGFFADHCIGSGESNLFNPLKEFEDAKFASKSHGLITSYAANTHQGIQRNYNEDRVSIILNMTRPENKDPATWPKCSFFAIYDGHGGSMCADFLKDHLHQIIITQSCFPADPKKALMEGCRIAEERFLRMADMGSRFDKSGSCAIIVLTVETECYVANVGDSRAILSADSGMRVYELSQDHRPNEEAEFYRIQANGGQVYQTQTFQNVPTTNQYGVVTGTQRQMLFGPYRVLPGRLSVSRTFGDIEAKFEKFGGKPGVVSAEPEISQFKIDENNHDFIVLGCDGIFDRMNSINTIDSAWSAMATALKQNSKLQESSVNKKPQTIHQITGKMADEILKRSAIERSFDNLTIVIVSFKNILTFYDQARKKQQKPSQAIKIEGETQSPRRSSNNNRGGSLATRSKNDGVSAPSTTNNMSASAGYQGFHTTKAKKLKDGITADKFGEPRKFDRDSSADAKPVRTPSGTLTTQPGMAGSSRQNIHSDSQQRQKNPVKQSDNLNNKRTSNSTQHDRDMSRKNINNNQKTSNGQTLNLDRKRSSDQALIGGVNAINSQNKQRESRNKQRDANGLNSIFNNSDEYMIGGNALQGHNTTGIPANRNGLTGDISRNPGGGLQGQNTFQKSNKDYQIQNAKYQNQLMLEQQKKIDQERHNSHQMNSIGGPSKSQNNNRTSIISKTNSNIRK